MERARVTLITVITSFTVAFGSYSQTAENNISDDGRQLSHEAILALSYQNGGLGFGMFYKKEMRKNRFFRIGLANVTIGHYTDSPNYPDPYKYVYNNYRVDLMTGYEFRFQLHPKVFAYTGIDVLLGYERYVNKELFESPIYEDRIRETNVIRAGLAFNSGVQVKVHEVIMVGVNITPNVFYARRMRADSQLLEDNVDNGVEGSFNSSIVQATVIFNWPRKQR